MSGNSFEAFFCARKAVRSGDVALLSQYWSDDLFLTVPDEFRVACNFRQFLVMDWFAERYPAMVTAEAASALQWAARRDDDELVRHLLGYLAPDSAAPWHATHVAAGAGAVRALAMLLKERRYDPDSVIATAAMSGSTAAVQACINAGATHFSQAIQGARAGREPELMVSFLRAEQARGRSAAALETRRRRIQALKKTMPF